MAVAPEIGVDHKERGHDAKPLDAVELILAHGLAVDDDVPGVGAGIALLRLFVGVEDHLDGVVAVAVDGELPALPVQAHDLFDELLFRFHRIAAPHGTVGQIIDDLVVRIAQVAGVALEAAVREELRRAERISPLRSALKRGIPFSNHNDTFVTPIDPLLSVWSAVNRRTSGGRILGENQTIPVMDALRSVTSWAAYQACEERIKGSLEPGKLADFVILEANPLTVAKETIKDIGISATIVGDEVVYGSLD